MKTRILTPAFVLALATTSALVIAATGGTELLDNGTFEKEGPMGGAQSWTRGDPALVKFETETVTVDGKETTNRFCRMDLPEPKAAIINQEITLADDLKTLDFSVRIRAKDVKTGEKSWQTGQFQFLFYDQDGKKVGGWNRLTVTEDTDGWKTLTKKGLAVPEGAVKLKCQLGVWGAAGTFDFDDASVMKPAE
jgi:hypothetical protein